MPSRNPHLAAVLAATLLTTSLGAADGLAAQPVLGAGSDATIPVPGQARARVEPSFTAYGSTFAAGARRGLGSSFSTDSFGPAQLPRLAAVRETLRALTGIPTLALSLGRVQVGGYAQTTSIPIQVEVGIAHRFALGLTVPYNKTRFTIAPTVNPGGTTGNFGLNPANPSYPGAASTAALAQNGRVNANLTAAAKALSAAGAAALADSVTRFAVRVASVYGTDQGGGANVVPLVGSDAQLAVVRQLASLAARAQAAGVALDSTVVPFPAQARIGLAGFRRAVADTSFGLAAVDSLGGGKRSSIGDVELTAMFQWLNTFGDASDSRGSIRARVAPGGRHIRSTLVGGFRFGTGSAVSPGVLLGLPPATGANAVLVRSITDVVFDRHLSVSGALRFTS
ncbi:MAG: hypothetical protein M3154_09665, partial [Candidatus Eremiobacteraeota bacterium]|nr:hypothetical protein [Candidatus Eremiobacteraeota bacterium]